MADLKGNTSLRLHIFIACIFVTAGTNLPFSQVEIDAILQREYHVVVYSGMRRDSHVNAAKPWRDGKRAAYECRSSSCRADPSLLAAAGRLLSESANGSAARKPARTACSLMTLDGAEQIDRFAISVFTFRWLCPPTMGFSFFLCCERF
jgi:hypothetical protein